MSIDPPQADRIKEFLLFSSFKNEEQSDIHSAYGGSIFPPEADHSPFQEVLYKRKEPSMQDIYHDRLSVIIVLIVFATIPAPEAGAEDYTCKIRSEVPQLFIIVYDVFPDGNPGKLIWQGVIKNGQQIEINAEFGRFFFRYKTKPESLDDLINGVNRFCKNGEILNLP